MNLTRIKLWLRRRLKLPAWCRDTLLSAAIAYAALFLTFPTPGPVSFVKILTLSTADTLTGRAFQLTSKLGQIQPAPSSGSLGYAVDLKVMDLWFALRGNLPPPKDVVIVGIDEESHSKLDVPTLAPWPRELQAKLLERLSRVKPRLILIDYSFRDRVNASTDARLASALGLGPTLIARAEKVEEMTLPDGIRTKQTVPIEPLPLFKQSAKGTFLANLPVDHGVIRGFKMVGADGEPNPKEDANLVPAMSLSLFGGLPGERKLPEAGDFLNYYGPPGAIPFIPFHSALTMDETALARAVQDKVVLIGQKLLMTYAAQQTDTFMTPFPSPMNGVEIHATAAANILDGSFIRGLRGGKPALLFFLAATLLINLLLSASAIRGLFILMGSIIAWTAGSYYLLLKGIFLPGAILVFGLMPLTFTLLTVRIYFASRRLERAIGVKR